MKVFGNLIVVIVVQLYKYTKITELYTLKGRILWCMDYIILFKKVVCFFF